MRPDSNSSFPENLQPSPLRIPVPAKGLRRLWNRGVLVAMHVLPGPLRRRLGWWRWDELMEGHRYSNALWVHGCTRVTAFLPPSYGDEG